MRHDTGTIHANRHAATYTNIIRTAINIVYNACLRAMQYTTPNAILYM